MSLYGFSDDEVQNFAVFIDNLEEDEKRYAEENRSNDDVNDSFWGTSNNGVYEEASYEDTSYHNDYSHGIRDFSVKPKSPYDSDEWVARPTARGMMYKRNLKKVLPPKRYREIQKEQESKKPICRRCCSEDVIDERTLEFICARCYNAFKEYTVLETEGPFYRDIANNIGSIEDMYPEAIWDYTWTDIVKYACEKGLLGDKKDKYESIIQITNINSLQRLHQEGNGIATARLADCYARGIGVPQDSRIAYKYFTMAESRGESYAAFVKANYIFYKGSRSSAYGFTVLGNSACAGNPLSMYRFGIKVYEKGAIGYKSVSLDWWRKSADLGFLPAAVLCRDSDSSLDQFRVELMRWEEDLANKGKEILNNPDKVMNEFDWWLYENRMGIIDALLHDKSVSIEVMNATDRLTYTEALKKLLGKKRVSVDQSLIIMNLNYKKEMVYEDEDDVDYESMSFEELMERAESRDYWAQFLVGVSYDCGDGVERSTLNAKKWYLKAAKNGEDYAYQNLLVMYTNAWEHEFFFDERNKLYCCMTGLAYEGFCRGNSWCNYNLGERLVDDSNEENYQNLHIAFVARLKGAMQYDEYCMRQLGRCFYNRIGVDIRDYSMATACYKKAAEAGNSGAMGLLGLCYEKGQGVTRDYTIAAKWYLEGYKNGNAYCGELYDRLCRENKVNSENLNKAINANINKASVSTIFDRVIEHTQNGYYVDAATNIRHIEETILSYFVQVFIPECIYDNKGVQRRKLEEMNAIPKHFMEILYNIGKIGNSGAHANAMNNTDVNEQDVKKAIPALKSLIEFYEAY